MLESATERSPAGSSDLASAGGGLSSAATPSGVAPETSTPSGVVPGTSTPPGVAPTWGGRVWLVAALALALVRFWRLGEWSLWYDEALTLADAYHGEPGYNALGYGVIRWTVEALGTFGGAVDEYALRLAPALAGWLAVAATWWAFRPFAGAHRAGLAACLVALSPWQVYWSQNARAYTLAELAGLIGGGLVLRGLWAGSTRRAVAGALVVALGVGFHLQCALLLAALIASPWLLHLAGRRVAGLRLEDHVRRTAVVLALCGALVLAAGAPWLQAAAAAYLRKKHAFEPLERLGHFVRSTGFFLTPLVGIAALVGVVGAWRARDRFHLTVAAVVLLGLGAGAAAALAAQVTAQYVFVFMPWVALLAAWPVDAAFARRDAALRAGFAAILLLPTLSGTWLYFAVRSGERPRWREAYAYVWNERAQGDLILGMQAGVGEFYLAPGSTDLRNPRVVAPLDEYHLDSHARWVRHGRPIWLVVRPDFLGTWPAADRAAFEAFLREDCHLRRRFPVRMEGRDLDLEVYYRPGDP